MGQSLAYRGNSRPLRLGLAGVFAVLFLSGCGERAHAPDAAGATSPAGSPGGAKITVGMMPKLTGIDYFTACQQGAQEAAKELGVELVYDGPLTGDTAKQSEMLDTWISRKFNVIAVSPNDPDAIAPVLRKAAQRGTKVLTFDADSAPNARAYFVNQATAESVGRGLVDVMAEQVGGQGEVAVITASLTDANQNAWILWIRTAIAEKYPGMKLVDVKPSGTGSDEAYQIAKDLMKAYPQLKGLFAISSIALPMAARAVREAQTGGKVAVTGLAPPSAMKPYVDDGTVKCFLLWSPVDLGYLSIYAAKLLNERGSLPPTFKAGRLGDIHTSGTEVLLGPPLRFDRSNIDKYDF